MPRKFEYYDRVRRPKLTNPKMTGEYTDYEIQTVKKSTGPNENDFELEEKIIEHKTDIKKFINSFSGDVGVHNIIAKIAKTGDMTLLNQTAGLHADLSQIPDDPEEQLKLYNNLEAAYSKIDPELTKGLTPEEFIKSLNAEKINSYINGVVDKKLAANKAKEGETK